MVEVDGVTPAEHLVPLRCPPLGIGKLALVHPPYREEGRVVEDGDASAVLSGETFPDQTSNQCQYNSAVWCPVCLPGHGDGAVVGAGGEATHLQQGGLQQVRPAARPHAETNLDHHVICRSGDNAADNKT